MVFVLDDNVYVDVVLPVVCVRHTEAHGVRLVLQGADESTARAFLGLTGRLQVRCADAHEHPMRRREVDAEA